MSLLLRYYEAVAILPETLSENRAQLPKWAEQIGTKREEQVRASVCALKKQISEIQSQLEGQLANLEHFRDAKVLFAGTGDKFADLVEVALGVLGFRAAKGPESHADIVAFDGKTILVVEAKGLEGPARAGDVGQIQRWKADVTATLGADDVALKTDPVRKQYAGILAKIGVDGHNVDQTVKGTLIIGTYWNTPIPQRPSEDFPDPVAKTCARAEICALTGLQLLGLWLDAEAEPGRKAGLITSILACVGRYPSRHWTDVIEELTEI